MKYDARPCPLVKKTQLTDTIFDFRISNKELAEIAKPGQFVHIRVPGKTLRRPISICDINGSEFRLVFEVRGEGTDILSQTEVGGEVDVIAPLGNGFKIEPDKRTVFIGGGIGVPPMLYAAKQSKNAVTITGFRDKSAVILEKDFKSIGEHILMTDNGSAGKQGFVTEALKDVIGNADMVCACGPMVMLRGVAEIASQAGVPCQISLEERMACGVGACLGCAVLVNREDGTQGYKHVCKNGPVFNAEEVVF